MLKLWFNVKSFDKIRVFEAPHGIQRFMDLLKAIEMLLFYVTIDIISSLGYSVFYSATVCQ